MTETGEVADALITMRVRYPELPDGELLRKLIGAGAAALREQDQVERHARRRAAQRELLFGPGGPEGELPLILRDLLDDGDISV